MANVKKRGWKSKLATVAKYSVVCGAGVALGMFIHSQRDTKTTVVETTTDKQ